MKQTRPLVSVYHGKLQHPYDLRRLRLIQDAGRARAATLGLTPLATACLSRAMARGGRTRRASHSGEFPATRGSEPHLLYTFHAGEERRVCSRGGIASVHTKLAETSGRKVARGKPGTQPIYLACASKGHSSPVKPGATERRPAHKALPRSSEH